MCRQLPTLCPYCDIHQVLLVQQALECPHQLRLVVVPPETEPLVRHHDVRSAELELTASVSAECQCIDLQQC